MLISFKGDTLTQLNLHRRVERLSCEDEMRLDSLNSIVQFRYNTPYFSLVDPEEPQSRPDLLHPLYMEYFFLSPVGFIAFTDQAVKFNREPSYLSFRFPVTYGDFLACSEVDRSLLFVPKVSPLLDYPEKPIWKAIPNLTFDYTIKDIPKRHDWPHTRLHYCSAYFLMYLYVRICEIIGYEINSSFLILNLINSIYNSRTYFTYITPAQELVYSLIVPPKILAALFSERFLKQHPEYAVIVPMTEAVLLSSENLGLRYGLGRIRVRCCMDYTW